MNYKNSNMINFNLKFLKYYVKIIKNEFNIKVFYLSYYIIE